MKLVNVTFLWAETGEPDVNGVRVVAWDTQGERSEFFDLSNSRGSCDGGWRSASDVERAAFTMALIDWMLRHGVAWNEIHAAFLEINEYRDWVENETGPFRSVFNMDF